MMLDLYDSHNRKLGSLADYNALHLYIAKHQDYQPSWNSWKFVHFYHSELCILCENKAESELTLKEHLALEQGYDLLAIVQGNPDHPVQIVVTPEIDIPLYLQDWCRGFCRARGIRIEERPLGKGGDDNDLVI